MLMFKYFFSILFIIIPMQSLASDQSSAYAFHFESVDQIQRQAELVTSSKFLPWSETDCIAPLMIEGSSDLFVHSSNSLYAIRRIAQNEKLEKRLEKVINQNGLKNLPFHIDEWANHKINEQKEDEGLKKLKVKIFYVALYAHQYALCRATKK